MKRRRSYAPPAVEEIRIFSDDLMQDSYEDEKEDNDPYAGVWLPVS